MAEKNMYSIRKIIALSLLFVILGTASATSITALIPPFVEKPKYTEDIIQDPLCYVVQTDKDTYYIGDTVNIYLVNLLEEKISFNDSSYGIRIEKWVNGAWELKQTLGNSFLTSYLDPVVNVTNRACVPYSLGENISLGRYRAVSIGEVSQNGFTIAVEAYKECEVSEAPPPDVIVLAVITDKDTYHYDDNFTIMISSQENNSAIFGNSSGNIRSNFNFIYLRLDGSSWVECENNVFNLGFESLGNLVPEEKLVNFILSSKIALGGANLVSGRYRILVEGWISSNEKTVLIWGCTEFTVE